MTRRTFGNNWKLIVLVVAATLIATLALAAQTPAPPRAQQAPPAQADNCPCAQNGNMPMWGQGRMMHRGMRMHHGMNGGQEMMAMHQEMAQKLQAMDQKLDGLVTTMNKARGNAKMEAMAAVINELVAQRQEMRKMVSSFYPMMGRGMHHSWGMGQGMGPGMGRMGNGPGANWKNCPMRNQAPQAPGKTPNPPQN